MLLRSTKLIIVALMVSLLTACSTSPKTAVVRVGDENLSREQIEAEFVKLDEVQKKVENNKGVTGTNIASVLFWWPGIAYTYYDASEATKLIEQRRTHLTKIYNKKYSGQQPAQISQTS